MLKTVELARRAVLFAGVGAGRGGAIDSREALEANQLELSGLGAGGLLRHEQQGACTTRLKVHVSVDLGHLSEGVRAEDAQEAVMLLQQ